MTYILLVLVAAVIFLVGLRIGVHLAMIAIDMGAADRLTPQECHELDRLIEKATNNNHD